HDLARLDGEVIHLGSNLRRYLLEQIVAGRLCREEGSRGLRWARRTAARAAGEAVLALADFHNQISRLESKNLGDYDSRDRALTRTDVLRTGLSRDCSILVDKDEALVGRVAPRGRPAPGVDRHADAVLHDAALPLPWRMPFVLPAG